VLAIAFLPGCAAVNRLHHPDPGLIFSPGEQPDKVLYQKATNEITHARYEVGRLTLQTLINTYPDSEYLSKAKLAIADSYYNEGGVTGLTQADAEYKDFITFFPTAPEAPEAQYRVGMAHVRMMAKADRDQTEAKVADAEFKEFLLKYPDSPLIPRVKGRLRQTQEVLAQGEYYTANFYYMHNAFPAARSRFQEILDKYPDFSGGDAAMYYEGQSLEHLRRGREAIPYYSELIMVFPLSPLVPQAKARLTAMKAPIPQPTRAMLARAQADASHVVERTWLSKLTGSFSGSPDTSATLFGPVHIGGTAAGGNESAKGPQPTAPTTAIVASPVSDKSLEPAKPAETTPPPSNDNAKATESTPDKSQSDAAKTAPPAKKKSKFHLLKKIVDPF
jgi:outer membrane protein assembly factor BamD